MNANISERVKQRYLLAILEKEQTTGVHLLKLFQEKANPNSYNVCYEDFIDIIARLGPSVTEEESSALFHDYQQLGQDTIDYRLLITEFDAVRQKHQVLTDILNQIIKQVQHKGSTLFDKFQSLDEDKSGFLPKKVFLDVFAFFNLHYEESSIQDIFGLLDSKEDHYSYRDFQEYFIKFLENYCKPMTTQIVKASISQRRSLFEALANNSEPGCNIKFGDFTNILTNLGSISQKDFDFLLVCLSIKLTSEKEININEFCSALQVFCERLNIISDEEIQQVFSRSKESKDLVKPQNNKIAVSPVEMQKIQNMFADIANFMKIDKISFGQLFGKRDYNKDGTITGHEFKTALCDDLFLVDNPSIGQLVDYMRNQQGNIDLKTLRNHLEQGVDTIIPVPSQKGTIEGLADEKVEKMFSEIGKFMKGDTITFEQLFSKKDENKDGKITEQEFKAALLEGLYISENPTLDSLINAIKNDQGEIDLVTLKSRLGLGVNAIEPAQNADTTDIIKTQQVEKMLGEIVKFMKDMNISFDQLFTVRDHDKTGVITEEDFRAALFEDLCIAENPTLCVLIESLRNDQGKIELLTLKNSLYED